MFTAESNINQDIHEIKIIISQLKDEDNFKLKRWLTELLEVKQFTKSLIKETPKLSTYHITR